MATEMARYQFDAENTHLIHNPNFSKLQRTMKNVKATCAENLETDDQTLLFVYFRGLAYHDVHTFAILNDTNKQFYPLEQELRCLATEENVFVVAFFDCPR